ncbi:hypothetical protein ACH4UY_15390 [Streptomyces longwoodensis]|uniref:hypothetical protein n=1 Tax=Streptomyces longwoodensis TaxID=68231 RepID=UPI00378ED7B7
MGAGQPLAALGPDAVAARLQALVVDQTGFVHENGAGHPRAGRPGRTTFVSG